MVSLRLYTLGTGGAERRLRNCLETPLVDDGPALRAESVLTLIDSPDGEIDANQVFRRVGECLLAALFQDAILRVAPVAELSALPVQKVGTKHSRSPEKGTMDENINTKKQYCQPLPRLTCLCSSSEKG